jgi:hypothetical protein
LSRRACLISATPLPVLMHVVFSMITSIKASLYHKSYLISTKPRSLPEKRGFDYSHMAALKKR